MKRPRLKIWRVGAEGEVGGMVEMLAARVVVVMRRVRKGAVRKRDSIFRMGMGW
jgi:hypothetical protein